MARSASVASTHRPRLRQSCFCQDSPCSSPEWDKSAYDGWSFRAGDGKEDLTCQIWQSNIFIWPTKLVGVRIDSSTRSSHTSSPTLLPDDPAKNSSSPAAYARHPGQNPRLHYRCCIEGIASSFACHKRALRDSRQSPSRKMSVSCTGSQQNAGAEN